MSQEQRFAAIFSAVFIILVAFPMCTQEDSFPHSNYPMFASPKPDKVNVTHLVALTEDGRRWIVPPGLVGTGEVLQARALLHQTAMKGEDASRALCFKIAAELKARGVNPLDAPFIRIEFRSDVYDVKQYFKSDQPRAESSVMHANCGVPG